MTMGRMPNAECFEGVDGVRRYVGHVDAAAFELKAAAVVELRDGRIARAADYIDVVGFVVQHGAQVELPGGVIIPPHGEAAQPGQGVRR